MNKNKLTVRSKTGTTAFSLIQNVLIKCQGFRLTFFTLVAAQHVQ